MGKASSYFPIFFLQGLKYRSKSGLKRRACFFRKQGVDWLGSEKKVVQGYLEGQGDLVSRLLTPLTHIVTQLTPIINLLTKSP